MFHNAMGNVPKHLQQWHHRETRQMNIYVGNLSYQMTDDELKTTFQVYGEVESARIITDRDTGRSKGFGFVEIKDNDQAQAAITALNGSDINGRNVTVNEARPKPQRSDRNGGGYGGGRGGGGYGGGGHGNGRNRY